MLGIHAKLTLDSRRAKYIVLCTLAPFEMGRILLVGAISNG